MNGDRVRHRKPSSPEKAEAWLADWPELTTRPMAREAMRSDFVLKKQFFRRSADLCCIAATLHEDVRNRVFDASYYESWRHFVTLANESTGPARLARNATVSAFNNVALNLRRDMGQPVKDPTTDPYFVRVSRKRALVKVA